MTEPITTRRPDPTNASPNRAARGIRRTWREVWTAPFRALREVYWVLDRDAKVRSRGLQTIGRVVRTETREHQGAEGGTYYTHHVTYEYQDEAGRHTAEKRVSSLGNIRQGVRIKVYFLPDAYPPASAIDTPPAALDGPEAATLEAGRVSRQ